MEKNTSVEPGKPVLIPCMLGCVPAHWAQYRFGNWGLHVRKDFYLAAANLFYQCQAWCKALDCWSQTHNTTAHGVCSSALWVTRTHWHNSHFNCLLLFIYRMCFIGIIAYSGRTKSHRLYALFSGLFSAIWLSGISTFPLPSLHLAPWSQMCLLWCLAVIFSDTKHWYNTL